MEWTGLDRHSCFDLNVWYCSIWRFYDHYLNRFLSPDTIIPSAADPQSWDRYSYANNNPIKFKDPSGHRVCESRDGYECDPKIAHLWDRADKILHKYGGKNDLEAMVKIINTAASLYRTYDEMIPALSGVFIGIESSNPGSLYNAAFHNTGCSGMGRDPGDCPTNDEPGESFKDSGFHRDFQDGHNQLFHYWAYLTTTASAQTSLPFVDHLAGLLVGGFGNVFHEIIAQDDQSTWQDYGLAASGMETGLYVGMDLIPPSQLGNYIRNDLGPGGHGGYGLVQLSVDLVPLQGNR